MRSSPRVRMTEPEYLAFENASPQKHYFVNGEVVAMAGGTFAHAIVCSAVGASLVAALKGGPCRVSNSDLRVRIDETGLYVYPDVVVTCDKPLRTPSPSRSLINPTAIVEVLSPGTEDDDRGWKWQHYQRIPTLKTYILVDPLGKRVDVYTRDHARWIYQVTEGIVGTVAIPAFDIELALADLFAHLEDLDEDGEAQLADE